MSCLDRSFDRSLDRCLSIARGTLTTFLLAGLAASAAAQVTLQDPVPLQGNQAENLAGTAAVNAAIGQAGKSKTSDAEFKRRRQHSAEAAACRQRARAQHPRGSDAIKAARARCDATFKALKATWYRPEMQAR